MPKKTLTPMHKSKIAVIGATGGLGQSLVSVLIKEKPECLYLCGRNEQELLKLKNLAEESHIACKCFAFDIKDEEKCSAFAYEIYANDFDRVVILTGISTSQNEVGLEDIFEINRGFTVNTLSPIRIIYNLSDLKIRDQNKTKKIQIAVVSSIASFLPLPSSPVYCASKAALNVYIRALRKKLSSSGIVLSLIMPGFFESPMSERYLGSKAFKLSANEAARKVLSVLKSGKAYVVFPFILGYASLFMSLLPWRLQDVFFRYFVKFKVEPDRERYEFEKQRKRVK